MFAICGYNFYADGNALDPSPIIADTFKSTTLTNGIFDHWWVSHDTTSDYTSQIPTAWDYLTVIDANFNGTLDAGNIEATLASVDGFKIKRRRTDEFNWITLGYISTDEVDNLSFSLNDNLAQSGVEYEYAFVPISGGIEGNYITNTINAKFEGVFICDAESIYRFYNGITYGTESRVQKIGVFEPYGRQYPVVVSNAITNYNTGSFNGYVLSDDFETDHSLNRVQMTEKRQALKDFLTNKKAKILKDFNGNYWLCIITGNVTTSFVSDYGMGIGKVSANWTEIGNPYSQKDLYNAGLLSEAE